MPCCVAFPFKVANIRATIFAAALPRRIGPGPDSRPDGQARSNSRSSPRIPWSRSIKLSAQPGKFAAGSAPAGVPAPRAAIAACRSPLRELAGQAGAVATGDARRAIAVSRADGLHRPVGRQGAARDLADRRHGLPGTALVVCRSRHQLRPEQPRGRRPRLRGQQRPTRGFDRCRSTLRAPASSAGWMPLHVRPRHPKPAMAEISPRVAGTPFAGQRSLIVGGSRGLGEVTAKIVAAGGGHPVITYRESRHEAERVVSRNSQAGGQCDILRYDALTPAGEQLEETRRRRLLLLFRDAKDIPAQVGLVRTGQAARVPDFYADGFFDLCTALAHDGPERSRCSIPRRLRSTRAPAPRPNMRWRRWPAKSWQSI